MGDSNLPRSNGSTLTGKAVLRTAAHRNATRWNATLLSGLGDAADSAGGGGEANQEIGEPKGFRWHSRGYLPHFDGPEVMQHVTYHLADSLPKDALDRLNEELKALPVERQKIERHKKVEAWMDAGHGSCLLRVPGLARMVQESLLFFDGERYRAIAWVVMPNHVHILFQPISGRTVANIVASWKKFTATRICAFCKSSTGNANLPIGAQLKPVWHREYWDRFIRDERHFQETVEYIHLNPVKAGLVARAEDWEWSSAGLGSGRLIDGV